MNSKIITISKLSYVELKEQKLVKKIMWEKKETNFFPYTYCVCVCIYI